VVGQIFVDLAFDIKKLSRIDELRALLAEGRKAGRRPLIIDAGANIGASSVFFAGQCPDALVVALEPEVANYQLLVANTAGLPVLPLPCALAAESGQCLLQDPGDGEWAYRTQVLEASSNEAGAISTVSIDDILDAHRNECFPFIVKIDIEGAESEVFSGAADWVEQVPLIIVEPHDWMLPRQRSAQPLLRRLAKSDRDFVIIGENIFSMSIDLPKWQRR
jgi:FkbM family methyltransferase